MNTQELKDLVNDTKGWLDFAAEAAGTTNRRLVSQILLGNVFSIVLYAWLYKHFRQNNNITVAHLKATGVLFGLGLGAQAYTVLRIAWSNSDHIQHTGHFAGFSGIGDDDAYHYRPSDDEDDFVPLYMRCIIPSCEELQKPSDSSFCGFHTYEDLSDATPTDDNGYDIDPSDNDYCCIVPGCQGSPTVAWTYCTHHAADPNRPPAEPQ